MRSTRTTTVLSALSDTTTPTFDARRLVIVSAIISSPSGARGGAFGRLTLATHGQQPCEVSLGLGQLQGVGHLSRPLLDLHLPERRAKLALFPHEHVGLHIAEFLQGLGALRHRSRPTAPDARRTSS